MNQFNLVENPWIPVRYLDGKQCLINLETAFSDARKITDLNCQPHERISLMRLLVCITQTVFAPPGTDEDWEGYAESMATNIPAYLNRDQIFPHFNLLGNGPRFLQVSIHNATHPVSISKLIPHLASGNNSTLLDQKGDDKAPRKFDLHVIALALLTFQNFYPLYGAGYKGKGPCVDSNMLHTLVKGTNLQDSVIRNSITLDIISEVFQKGLGNPIWELRGTRGFDTEIATLSYLGRLVPRHRSLYLNEDLKGFYLSKESLIYPTYEEVRETSATTTVIKKGRNHKRGLVRARLDKGVWRDLHLVTMIRERNTEDLRAPLSLQAHYNEGEDEQELWLGALITDLKAKIIDSTESSLTVPQVMFGASGRNEYQRGIEYSEKVSKKLYGAVKQYGKELKVEKPQTDAAKRHFWNALDQQVDTLLEIVRHPETRKEDFGMGDDAWTLRVNRAALMAFQDTCPRRSPRQLKAFAAGLRTLRIKNKPPLKI